MSDAVDLDAIRARYEAATPGPWVADRRRVYWNHRDEGVLIAVSDDAWFIAAARTDIPLLVAEVVALREEVATLTDDRNAWVRNSHRWSVDCRAAEQEVERLRTALTIENLTTLMDAHAIVDDDMFSNLECRCGARFCGDEDDGSVSTMAHRSHLIEALRAALSVSEEQKGGDDE